MPPPLLRRAWKRLFRHHPYAYLGRLVYPLVSERYKAALVEHFFSADGPRGLLAELVRAEINRRYYAGSDADARRLNRARFWGGAAGREWHAGKRRYYADAERFEGEFMRYKRPLVEQLEALLAARPGEFGAIVEIGTGHGLFLEVLERRFPAMRRYLGIDVNTEQIAQNRRDYAGTRLEFSERELRELAPELARGVILVACGTLECLTPQELGELLRLLRTQLHPAALAISEPVNLDLERDTASRPRGNTMYSHNYPHLLRAAGYDIFRQQAIAVQPGVPDYHNVILVALTRA
jgi:trans-aconitate methyltransferase